MCILLPHIWTLMYIIMDKYFYYVKIYATEFFVIKIQIIGLKVTPLYRHYNMSQASLTFFKQTIPYSHHSS